jgi:peptidoglycan/xylan/chitin deacetylase (PgdA/CDA1 family)
MTRFYLTTLTFIILLTISVLTLNNWWLFALLLVIYLGILGYASATIQTGFYLSAQCRFKPSGKEVALTFDDGPDPIQTPVILDLLKTAGFKATFFCVGEHLKNHPELVKKIIAEGHTIGNHTYSHSNGFPLFSAKKMKTEIEATQKLIEQFYPAEEQWFRPPFGVTNPTLAKALKNTNLKIAGWSIRSFDTKNLPKEKILNRITSKLKPGEIILMHDTSQHIEWILTQLIKFMQKEGYTSVSLNRIKHETTMTDSKQHTGK